MIKLKLIITLLNNNINKETLDELILDIKKLFNQILMKLKKRNIIKDYNISDIVFIHLYLYCAYFKYRIVLDYDNISNLMLNSINVLTKLSCRDKPKSVINTIEIWSGNKRDGSLFIRYSSVENYG